MPKSVVNGGSPTVTAYDRAHHTPPVEPPGRATRALAAAAGRGAVWLTSLKSPVHPRMCTRRNPPSTTRPSRPHGNKAET